MKKHKSFKEYLMVIGTTLFVGYFVFCVVKKLSFEITAFFWKPSFLWPTYLQYVLYAGSAVIVFLAYIIFCFGHKKNGTKEKNGKIKQFISSWKEAIIISIACIALFYIAEPDYENPFYPNKLRTGEMVMAEKWPVPEPNDPNFLADYREYMGYEWEEYIKIGE